MGKRHTHEAERAGFHEWMESPTAFNISTFLTFIFIFYYTVILYSADTRREAILILKSNVHSGKLYIKNMRMFTYIK